MRKLLSVAILGAALSGLPSVAAHASHFPDPNEASQFCKENNNYGFPGSEHEAHGACVSFFTANSEDANASLPYACRYDPEGMEAFARRWFGMPADEQFDNTGECVSFFHNNEPNFG